MKTMRWTTSVLLIVIAACYVVISPRIEAATLIANYRLNGSLADSAGGPPIENNGATLSATGLTFPVNGGPTVRRGDLDVTDYTISVRFRIDETSSWRKLIDFEDLTSDNGQYNLDTMAQFYPWATGPAGAFQNGIDAHLVVTRNGVTNKYTAFVDGVQQFEFTDDPMFDAVISSDGNGVPVLHFFQDDLVVVGEASAGFVDCILIYDGSMTVAEAQSLTPCAGLDFFSTRSSHYAVSTLLQQQDIQRRSVSGGAIALEASFLTPWVGLDALEALADGTYWFSTLSDGVVDGLLLQHENAYAYDPATDTIDPTPVLDGVSLGLRSLDAIADLGSAPDDRIAFSVDYDQFGPNLKQQNVYILTPPSTITLGINLATRGLFSLDALDIVPGPFGLTRPIVSTAGSQFLSTPSGIVFLDQRSAYQLDLATTPVTVTPVLTGPFVDLDAVALARGIFP